MIQRAEDHTDSPCWFLWKVFLLHLLKDKMLTCKEMYLEGPCGKFSVMNTFVW